jgi:FkbM family methyltransferase
MPLSFRLKKIIEVLGFYDFATLAYLKWIAVRRNIKLETNRTADSETIRFHGPHARCIIISRRHIVYGADMINFFDYYYDAVIPSSQDGESIVDYSRPAWHTLKESGVKFHFSSLPESDTTTSIYLKKAALGPDSVVIDLGGYCGASSYFFAKTAGPNSRILCLEPDPLNYDSLLRNIQFHQLKNVTSMPLAVWSHSGKLRFETEGNMGSGVYEIHARNTHAVGVESITLEELAAKQGLERIDFIKMDIEGAESVVLRAAASLLKKYRPCLIVEPHIVAGKLNTDEVAQILRDIGYTLEFIPQGELKLPLIFAKMGAKS